MPTATPITPQPNQSPNRFEKKSRAAMVSVMDTIIVNFTSPAKVVRELTEKEKESILANAALYLEKSKEYRAHAAKQA